MPNELPSRQWVGVKKHTVILSEVAGSHREAAAQSKDPCSFYGSVGNQKGILL